MQPQVISIGNLPQNHRVARSPKHHFQLRHRPYQIQPFAIAPVLPGETLKTGSIQVRAKTDGLKNDLLGWHLEHYVFKVSLTDLDGRDDFVAKLLDNTHSLAAYTSAANAATYHAGGGINWTQLCLNRVVDEYFRDEGDAPALLDGLPIAQRNTESWLDSAKLASATSPQDELFPGQDPEALPGFDATFAARYAQWEHMRALKMTEATYEDWLAAYGVKAKTEPDRTEHKPELVRYSRAWQYPSTIVDGATGSSSSAVVWSIAESINKARFFREPGFLLGVTVARPKVYVSKQLGSAAMLMSDAYAWLPATLHLAPHTSLRECISNSAAPGGFDGPLGDLTAENYWVDVRDLLIYGDQFINFALTETNAGLVALPTAAMEKKYVASADIDALFKDALAGNKVRQDGIFQPTIMGRQTDQT